MIAKAENFAKQLGKPNWTCSAGWLDRFKKRYGITYHSLSGESSSVDKDLPQTWITEKLQPILKRFEAKDVFNADETGLFWKLLPSKTMAFKGDKCHGGKKSKERVTVMVCSNMDGSEK